MTVRVTTLKGPEAGAYYVEALPTYYLDSGEPPARWHGAGSEILGLTGEVDDDAFLAVLAGDHPGTGKPLGRRLGEDSVRGFDVTASAPKSVSVLFALGDDHVRQVVLDAHDTAVVSMVGWIEAHALTRYRIGGEVAVVDAEGIVAATFRQHSSRAGDPQLHTHVVIPNRVRAPDGRWLALDARGLKVDQRTLSALYHAGLRAELRRHLGVAWQEVVNGIAEMHGVPEEVLAEFSSRSAEVAARRDEKLERFWQTYGRAPTPRERWRLEREAVIDSRPAKSHGVDVASLHEQWQQRTRALGREPEDVVAGAVSPGARHRGIDGATQARMVAQALHALAERQSTWRPAELVRELAAAVPPDVAVAAGDLVAWLDRLAEGVVADLVDLSRPIPEGARLRRDGRPVSESVLDRVVTSADILAEEELLLAWADKRLARRGSDAAVAAAAGVQLTGPQRRLAAAVAGDHELVLAVGPAGTGKTTALAPAVERLRADGRAVFGVAPSATAAEVLAADTGVEADTLDKLLVEHRLTRPPEGRLDLPAGATVIVDEAAMVPTAGLAELADLAERRGWRVALVGDPMQFSSVGRGGMFSHLVEACGAIELDRVQRFANHWERDASLRLRRGDAGVVDLYDDHGRLHGGNRIRMEATMVRAWAAARARGESAAMMAPTKEAVASLNHRAQQLRARSGAIDLEGPSAQVGHYNVVVGDDVATRRNDRHLRTDRGLMVKNRDHWDAVAVHPDGGLTVSGRTGTVRLPGDYVKDHVELAYAETSHANQGRTVDRSFLLLDRPTDTAGVYVPLTRGRKSNEAFVVTGGEESAADVVAESLARDWIDQPAVARRAELQRKLNEVISSRRPSALPPLGPVVLRQLMERHHALTRSLTASEMTLQMAAQQLRQARARRAELARRIEEAELRLGTAEARIADLDRPLRRRRHRAELDSAAGTARAARSSIEADRSELAELDVRLPVLESELAKAKEAMGQRPRSEMERYAIQRRLDTDVSSRVAGLAAGPPEDLVRRLGPRPFDRADAALWDKVAARVEQHRAAFGITDSRHLLGRKPQWHDGAYAASHRAAIEACERLEQALGRDVGVEPPGRGLGLSL